VKRKDEAKHGEYRTKQVILEIYDEMTDAQRDGTEYRTRLEPAAGASDNEKPREITS